MTSHRNIFDKLNIHRKCYGLRLWFRTDGTKEIQYTTISYRGIHIGIQKLWDIYSSKFIGDTLHNYDNFTIYRYINIYNEVLFSEIDS